MTGLSTARELLDERIGALPSSGEPRDWTTLLRIVVGRGVSEAKLQANWAELLESPLRAPRQTAECSADEIEEFLSRIGRARENGALLLTLARWWGEHAAEDNTLQWEGNAEELREALRSLRGVSLELADRIGLFVADQPVFPVDRAAIRIACRHGWMGVEADYEEWQSSLAPREAESVDLRRLSLQFTRIGHDHCGPKPRCTGCPLESLLPEGGPYSLDEA
jgi:endonuclease III